VAERPVRALRFAGFGLRIWRWPLMNLLLELRGVGGRRTLWALGAATNQGLTPTMANVETWHWIDSKGRKRELVIHREIKE